MSRRVGTLSKMQLPVYRNRGGSLFWRDGRVHKRLHGATLWQALDGRRFRGQRPLDGAPNHGGSDSDDPSGSNAGTDDEDLQLALSASLQDEDAMLRSAIAASLAGGQDAPRGEQPRGEQPRSEPPRSEQPPVEQEGQRPQCCICMEPIVQGARALPCSHAFHRTCIDRWVRQHRACPVCRQRV